MKKYKNKIIVLLSLITIFVLICFIPFNATKLIPTIEEQVSKDFGFDIHIERLILRFGPHIKVKAPTMHILYEDGQKFAQFDNVKFFIPWTGLLKNSISIHKLQANRWILRVNSDDKYLPFIFEKIKNRGINAIPNIKIKEYNLSYNNRATGNKYILSGQFLDLSKIRNYDSFKLITKGDFLINSQKHVSYDLILNPYLNLSFDNLDADIIKYIEQIKDLEFSSDLLADIKLYKNNLNLLQASGFINIDNIAIHDITKKGPKSFVYLTLWGDKASILSNIYTSATNKVYIEGMINNSKKPIIDVKVKADEIRLKDLYNKIKILVDLSYFKCIDYIDGKLNANFNLKGDLNKIKSSGYLKIEEGLVKANGLKIEDINSDIDFSNNSINITKAVGYVNKSPIMAHGSINKEVDIKLLMNKVELKYLFPEKIGINSGIASVVATIKGHLNNIISNVNLQVENLQLEKFNTKLKISNIKYDSNISKIALIDNIIINTPETEVIKIPSAKVQIDNDIIRLLETSVLMNTSKLALKGDLLNYKNENLNYNLNLFGIIESSDILKLKNTDTKYPILLTLNGNKNSYNINSQILLEKSLIFDESTLVNLATRFEKNTFKVDDISLSNFNGAFINDVKSNLKGNKNLIISGNIENNKTPTLKNVRIFIPQLLNIKNVYDTQGQIKGDLFVNGELNKPEIVGQLNIQNLINQTSQLNIQNCNIDFNKNVAIFNAPNIKLADNILNVNTLISTNLSNGINIKNANIKSKNLNTETLLMYKDTPLFTSLPITVSDGNLYSEKLLINLYNKPLCLTAFSSAIALKDNVLSVKNITSEIFNGKLGGNIDFNMKNENFTSKFMGRGVSSSPIFEIFSPRKESISGIMDFDSDISGDLLSKKSLKGDIKFIINNGRMATLGKLEHLLYAQNVIADSMLRTSLSIVTKAITLKDTGLFKYIKGDINLENGIAKINMLQTQGPSMSLFIKGYYQLDTDWAQLIVLGRLSDEIISGLGAFGDFSLNKLMIMLTGDENKYNIVPEDIDKLPQLASKNTKEFRSIINGIIDKPSSVLLFNWISYTQKSLRQKEVQLKPTKLPSFVEALPY